MMSATPMLSDPVAEGREVLTERLMNAASGTFTIFSVYLGDQLGFYETLSNSTSLTAAELAARTGTHLRYVREWLEQQAVAGLVCVEDAEVPEDARRFYLPPGHEEVLAQPDSLSYLAPMAQLIAGAARPLEAVLSAYRTGAGVPYELYGKDLREGQARMNRAMFLYQLGQEWLAAAPGLAARLNSEPAARIADLGCGAGWSSIGAAQCYPKVQVDGFDLDEASIELARQNAKEARLTDRVRFQARDAGDPELAGRYDLVMALECVHDMSDPVAALRSMHRLAKPGATVFVVDERVEEQFTPQANGLEWFMYGFSVLHCLPVGMSAQPSAATGTVMRTGTFRAYAREAGFGDVQVLPIDHAMFRFYQLRQ
jgi:ubiquinone/menaquinone biosynthesis C-methylase UbiE